MNYISVINIFSYNFLTRLFDKILLNYHTVHIYTHTPCEQSIHTRTIKPFNYTELMQDTFIAKSRISSLFFRVLSR